MNYTYKRSVCVISSIRRVPAMDVFFQFLQHFLGGDSWTRIIPCGLKYAAEQLAPEVGVRLQIPVLAEGHEGGFARIAEYPFFNEPRAASPPTPAEDTH
jgi:hypothetical protein